MGCCPDSSGCGSARIRRWLMASHGCWHRPRDPCFGAHCPGRPWPALPKRGFTAGSPFYSTPATLTEPSSSLSSHPLMARGGLLLPIQTPQEVGRWQHERDQKQCQIFVANVAGRKRGIQQRNNRDADVRERAEEAHELAALLGRRHFGHESCAESRRETQA